LNAREARALAALRALGGDLDAGALDRDLRRVFRRLARRYHPDRHPGLDAPARAALAARFSTLVEAYRVLAARTTRAS
jgi:curved DNA-binding protein CbpA